MKDLPFEISKRALAIIKIDANGISKEQYSNCDESTLFNIASITKFFTALCFIKLEEKKLVSPEDLVTKHLENFPFKSVKVEHLIHHESGIPNYYDLIANDIENITNEDVMNLLHNMELQFSPGSRFDYSNTNYIILYQLIEKLSKMSYHAFIKQVVFSNQIDDIKLYKSHSEIIPKLIPSYSNGVINKLDSLTLGDGGILLSGSQFSKIINLLNDPAIVSQKEWDQITTLRQQLTTSFTEHYGYGVTIEPTKGIFYHTGLYASYRSILHRNFINNETIVILCNDSSCSYEERMKIIKKF